MTIAERLHLVRRVIEEEKWEKKVKYVIPIPDVSDNIAWTRYIVDMLPPFDVVVSGNKTYVLRFFKSLGYKTEYLPYVNRSQFQGTVIRQNIVDGKKWEDAIPSYLLSLLQSFHFTERIKNEEV